MEIRLQDFPCLYYMSERTERKEQAVFYSALSAMFGMTASDAADASVLFAHGSHLFKAKEFTCAELEEHGQVYFEKPYKDCRSFYRKAIIKKIGLQENACVLCPLSANYANGRIEEERIVLKSIFEGCSDAFQNNLTPDNFTSYLALSCSNDVGTYPVFKFHSVLFDVLQRHFGNGSQMDPVGYGDEIADTVHAELTKKGGFIPLDTVREFVTMQIKQIQSTECSPERLSVAIIRLYMEYVYTPEKIVFPRSVKKAERPKKIDSLNKQAFPDITVDEKQIELKKEVLVPEPAENPLMPAETSVPIDVKEDVSVALAPVSEEVPPSTLEEAPVLDVDEDSSSLSDEEDPILVPGKKRKKKKKKKNRFYESHPAILDDKTKESLSAVRFNYNYNMYFRGAFEHKSLPIQVPSRCASCTVGTSFHVSNLRYASPVEFALYQYCAERYRIASTFTDDVKSFEYYPALSVEGKEYTSLCHAAGCAMARNRGTEIRTDCIYGQVPSLSPEFKKHVINCTYSNIPRLLDFASEACNCQHISIEAVSYEGITGLLFYVNGKFYYINHHYDIGGFLKPVFADTSKVRFYSVNPIYVHSYLHRLGFKHIRIESVAAFYSAAIGVQALLPTGMIFDLSKGRFPDIYSRIMPQYHDTFNSSFRASMHKTRAAYEKGLRLEWALGYSTNLSHIARNISSNVIGGNFLRYEFGLKDVGKIAEKGTLFIISMRSPLGKKNAKRFWEDVVGRVAASSHKFINYAYLLSLTEEKIVYYCCYESSHFYDVVVDIIRAAYRDFVGGVPEILIECEEFR